MINAGALAVTSLIRGATPQDQLNRLLRFIRELANDKSITYCKETAASEFETSMINRAMCYYMKQYHIIRGNVEEVMDVYTKQCAIMMNSLDLAKIACVFH